MINRVQRLVIVLVALGLSLVTATAQETKSLTHEGFDRAYRVYVPDALDPDTPAPLVIALHGYGMTGAEFAEIATYDQLAEQYGAIVVYPSAASEYWDYHADTPIVPGETYTYDDTLIPALIDAVSASYAIDETRISLVGFNIGGLMALHALCNSDRTYQSVVIINATLTDRLAYDCVDLAEPTPLMYVLGTAGGVFPTSGVASAAENIVNIRLSLAQTLNYFRTLYQCGERDSAILSTDDSPYQVVGDVYFACQRGGFFILYLLIEYGDTYPLEPTIALDTGAIGITDDAIWEFLMTQSATSSTPAD